MCLWWVTPIKLYMAGEAQMWSTCSSRLLMTIQVTHLDSACLPALRQNAHVHNFSRSMSQQPSSTIHFVCLNVFSKSEPNGHRLLSYVLFAHVPYMKLLAVD